MTPVYCTSYQDKWSIQQTIDLTRFSLPTACGHSLAATHLNVSNRCVVAQGLKVVLVINAVVISWDIPICNLLAKCREMISLVDLAKLQNSPPGYS